MRDAVRGREIGGHDSTPSRAMGLKRRGILVGDDDNRTFLGEQIRDSPADAVRAGADKGELS